MSTPEERLAKAQRFLEVAGEEHPTNEEVADIFSAFHTFVVDIKKELDAKIDTKVKQALDAFKTLSAEVKEKFKTLKGLRSDIDANKKTADRDAKDIRRELGDEIRKVKILIPEETDLSRVEADIDDLWAKIRENAKPHVLRDALEKLVGDEQFDHSKIRGLEKFVKDIIGTAEGVKVVNWFGGPTGLRFLIGGVKKGILNTVNFVAGTGVSISHSKVNGLDTLTFEATASGSGVTVETPPESPDAVIVAFTVSDQPQWVVADGTTYYEGAGYSYGAGTVTMDVPPSSFIRAII